MEKPHSCSYNAVWKSIYLQCDPITLITKPDSYEYIGWVRLFPFHRRHGPIRKLMEAAKQDAQRLAVELLQDIRDGTKSLMDYYEMGEDD